MADTDEKRTKGLSGRKNLDEKEAMLFVFPEKKQYQFWMKDMNFPIDIIFINDDIVTNISKNAQPIDPKSPNYTIYSPTVDINYVLEVNAGQTDKHGIKIGDKVEIKK